MQVYVEGYTLSFSIIVVNPRPVMDQVESQTICSGTAFDAPIYNSNKSRVYDYSWTLVNASEISEFGSDISGYPHNRVISIQFQGYQLNPNNRK